MSDSARQFHHADRFLLRAPLLPFTWFLRWSEGLRAAAAADEELAGALAADRELLRQRLSGLVTQPVVADALRLTRPEVAERTGSGLGLGGGLAEEKARWWERKLTRLFTRVTGRAAPLGAFATVSVGRAAEVTSLALGSIRSVRTRSRPAYAAMHAVAARLEPHLRAQLRYVGPAAVYAVGASLRCLRSRYAAADLPHELATFDPDEALTCALRAASGGCTFEEIVRRLVAVGSSDQEARAYVEQLVEEGLLRSDLHPPIPGPDARSWLSAALARAGGSGPVQAARDALNELANALGELDAAPLGEKADAFERAHTSLRALGAGGEVFPLDAVSVRPSEGLTLGKQQLEELSQAADALLRLTPRREDRLLGEFLRRFTARYGSTWVPLMEVLDEEIGIGFPPTRGAVRNPPEFLQDPAWRPRAAGVELGEREAYLLERIAGAGTELRLDERDLEALAEPDPLPLPESFFLVASLGRDPASQSWFAVVEGAGGPSAARLWARFAHADDEIHAFVRACVDGDRPPCAGAVFAEVGHVPMLRTAFAFQRPPTYEFTIDVSGAGACPRTLALSELLVGARDGRAVLYAPRIGKEILPRLTAAHNVGAHGLSIDLFLSALQQQDFATPLSWQWGALERLPALPRVSFGRIVLRPAQWRFASDARELLRTHDDAARWRALRRWRERWSVPRFVLLGDGELPIDLDNPLSVDGLVQSVRKSPGQVIQEMLPSPAQLAAAGPEGAYVHQLVIPFSSHLEPRPRTVDVPTSAAAGPAAFPPGSPWLSVKMYCADESADALLCDVIGPAVAAAQRDGWIDRWFFIRYADPDFHLRVRFHGDGQQLLAQVWPLVLRVARASLDAGVAWRLELDTYVPQSHTTGGPAFVDQAASVFLADSEAALQCVQLRRSSIDQAWGDWAPAIVAVDTLLADFGLGLGERVAQLRRLRDAWMRHVGLAPGRGSLKLLTAIQRDLRHNIEALLAQVAGEVAGEEAAGAAAEAARGAADPGVHLVGRELATIFGRRSAQLRPAVEAYRAGLEASRLSAVLGSFIHLCVNRLVPCRANATEVVVYHSLMQHYEGLQRRRSFSEDHNRSYP